MVRGDRSNLETYSNIPKDVYQHDMADALDEKRIRLGHEEKTFPYPGLWNVILWVISPA